MSTPLLNEDYVTYKLRLANEVALARRISRNAGNRLRYAKRGVKQSMAAWKRANPEKVREYERKSRLKNKYGITEADYLALIEKQNGLCAICSTNKPTGRNGKWHIDHCHTTGAIRGLLCGPCNQALGLFRDNIENIQKALNYLRKQL